MRLSFESKLLMTLLIILLFTPIVLSLIPLKPLTVRSITIENPDKRVIAGERIFYTVDAVKHTKKSCIIIRQLINERTLHYTPIQSNIPATDARREGCLDTSMGDMPGVYFIRWTAVYKYFGFRDVEVVAESDKLTMVAPEALKGIKGDNN